MKVTLQFRGQSFDVSFDGDVATVNGIEVPLKRDGNAIVAGGSVHQVTLGKREASFGGDPESYAITALEGVAGAISESTGTYGPVKPPMTGTLQELCVEEGQSVARGDVLFVLEAMKMQNEIKAPVDGVVQNVQGVVGEAVDTGTVVLELHAPDS